MTARTPDPETRAVIALLLSAPLLAPPPPLARTRPGAAGDVFAKRVFHDADEAGDLWARGVRWKMRFGPGQERHPPLAHSPAAAAVGAEELAFDRAAAPLRDGDRVLFDRGPLLEVYDLAPDAVEQSFVFPEVPRGGDLVLTLELGCDLAGENAAHGGVGLLHALGRCSYSQAVALDGLGRRLPVETRFVGTSIGIRVPAAFLEAAEAPLVIDPVVSVEVLDGSEAYSDSNPETSYDATHARWLVVWERVVTDSDSDVVYRLLDEAGGTVSIGYLNLDSASWSEPVVANANLSDCFYVAATVNASFGQTAIKGRVLPANAPFGSSGGPVYQISHTSFFPSKADPLVYSSWPSAGGDPSTGTGHGNFCVAWREITASGSAIRFRRVNSKGAPLDSKAGLLGDHAHSPPCITASNAGFEWTIVYGQPGVGNHQELALARVRWDGVVTPAALLDVTVEALSRTCISSAVEGQLLIGAQGTYGYILAAVQGLQVLDEEFFPYEGVKDLELAADGQRFVLGSLGSSVYVATFTIEPAADQIALVEQALVDFYPASYYEVEWGLASRSESGGAPGSTLLTWTHFDEVPTPPYYDLDIWIALYAPE